MVTSSVKKTYLYHLPCADFDHPSMELTWTCAFCTAASVVQSSEASRPFTSPTFSLSGNLADLAEECDPHGTGQLFRCIRCDGEKNRRENHCADAEHHRLQCFNAFSSQQCWLVRYTEMGWFTDTKTSICVAHAFSCWLIASIQNMSVFQMYSGMAKKNGTFADGFSVRMNNFALPAQILRWYLQGLDCTLR